MYNLRKMKFAVIKTKNHHSFVMVLPTLQMDQAHGLPMACFMPMV